MNIEVDLSEVRFRSIEIGCVERACAYRVRPEKLGISVTPCECRHLYLKVCVVSVCFKLGHTLLEIFKLK